MLDAASGAAPWPLAMFELGKGWDGADRSLAAFGAAIDVGKLQRSNPADEG